MATSNAAIRVDKNLKDKADELFTNFAFNFTTTITVFAKQIVREQKIPFILSRVVPPASFAFEESTNAQRIKKRTVQHIFFEGVIYYG